MISTGSLSGSLSGSRLIGSYPSDVERSWGGRRVSFAIAERSGVGNLQKVKYKMINKWQSQNTVKFGK
ncbi:hypothetical protein E2C01_061646 [Portunus trituberculatus]|uniref:Uncharacterized protein n=1 Tax=Portunus trituberculatus TaxID=210409 RepID=A0A5B7HC80_PORTR|nr:hypothetical protein [Portunus trituberculatus]